MFSRSIKDPYGYVWEIGWMDAAATPRRSKPRDRCN